MSLIELSGIVTSPQAARSIADKVRNLGVSKVATFKEFRALLDDQENELVDWLLSLRPNDVGVNTPFCGLEEPTPETPFYTFTDTRYVNKDDGSVKTYEDTNYVPLHIWHSWQALSKEMVAAGLGSLKILSGYRSPAYQSALLCYRLSHATKTPLDVFEQMSLPGFSQHGLIHNCAIDLVTDEHFADSPEYEWMLNNASKYGFYLSYAKDNPFGIVFEPWHWQWRGDA